MLPDMSKDPDPIGLLSLANCECGTTLSLTCENLAAHSAFNEAVRLVVSESGQSAAHILTELRDEIRALARRGDTPSK
jgi:hypothetical protein